MSDEHEVKPQAEAKHDELERGELERTVRELQLRNEELTTVNERLESRILEQEAATRDLNTLLHSTNIAVVVLDRELRIRRYTAAVRELLDLIPADVGRPFAHLARKFVDPRLTTDAAAVLEHPTPMEREIEGDSGRWYLRRLLPHRTTNDQTDGVVLTFVDITASKGAEHRRDSEALRFDEEQFRMLVDGARDHAMLLLDPDGIITAWNVGAERVLGYREAEAVGQSVALIFTPEDRAAGAHHRERADSARDGRAEDARWHLRKDGQRFFSNGVMSSLRAPDGSVRGFVKILRDDTARKLAEEALKRSAEESASANRMKDTFLATLSHELRTPLAAIQLWAHVLKKQKPDDLAGKARAVDAIAQSALAQNQLIDDLLDTVRISSGALRLAVQACELTPLLHTWVESIRLTADAKGIELALDFDPTIGMVATDPDRLQQVVWNLLKNAVTFTPPGGQVKVTVRRRTNELQIRITDSGAGIDPDFLPHVFEAFRQGDSSNSRSTGGLGLGLSIVWKLVHLLGGTIRAESDGLGLGATFVVRLPASPAPHGRRRESTEELVAVRSTQLHGLRILVVEDTAETREAMRLILQSAGSEVTAAENATTAFAAYLAGPPSLIVSDIAMPGEDGFSLMKRIRAHERTQGGGMVPAIAVTALAHEDDRAMILESGFDAHLVKPFEAEGLILALVDLLGQESVSSRRGKSD